MKVFLFGGAETALGQFLPQIKLIEQVIQEINPQQVLHIPFARTKATEAEWEDGWFDKNIDIKGVEYLDAKNKSAIDKADSPLILISGGGENVNLMKKIQNNPKLLSLIKNSSYIIGESAGAMILGAYFRIKTERGNKLMEGLSLIKDTIIEPHYTERKREDLLREEMRETNVTYGIGIDCVTAIAFEIDQFPGTYRKIGNGRVEIIKTKA